MKEAIALAKKSYEIDEVPIGAVVVYRNKVVGKGYNQVVSHNSVSKHAEIIAIEDASKNLKNYRLNDAVIFSTIEPCHMCTSAIIQARIKKIFYGACQPKTGALQSIDSFQKHRFHNHQVDTEFGLMEAECKNLIKSFFISKRQKDS